MTDNVLPNGMSLGDEFVIERTLGNGAFGITYLVRALDDITDEVSHDDLCVVKECYPRDYVRRDGARVTAAGDPAKAKGKANAERFHSLRRGFMDEAMTLSHFYHPSIVRVFLMRQANGTAYMVMEYIEGDSLEDLFRRSVQEDERPLAFEAVHALALPLIDALEVVHDKGIVHRDIKPANVMLRADGQPVLIDFGGAKPVDEADLSVVMTRGFAPPEQRLGQNIGPWTDIYGLAATLYFALIGRPPILETEGGAIYVPLAQHPRREVYGIPLAFAEAIDSALEPDWTKRVQTVADWRRQMHPHTAQPPEKIKDPEPEVEGPKTPPEEPIRRVSPAMIGLLTCIGVLVVLVIAFVLVRSNDQTAQLRQDVTVVADSWTPVDVRAIAPGAEVSFASDQPFRLRVNGAVYSFADSNSVVTPDIPRDAVVELKAVGASGRVSMYF